MKANFQKQQKSSTTKEVKYKTIYVAIGQIQNNICSNWDSAPEAVLGQTLGVASLLHLNME